MMTLSFRTIDWDKDLDFCIRFRKDSFRVIFNNGDGSFNENEYRDLLMLRIAQFPWG
jgi:hypothetical protein